MVELEAESRSQPQANERLSTSQFVVVHEETFPDSQRLRQSFII